MEMQKDLENKVAIVTGSSRGIGKAIAIELAANGAKVAINCNKSHSEAEEVLNQLHKMGAEAILVDADISKPSEVKKLVEETVKQLGKIDIFISNAGIMPAVSIEKTDEAIYDEIFDTNVKGAYFGAKYAFEQMNDGGVILINASTIILSPHKDEYSVYSMTKGALDVIPHTLSMKFAKRNITINCFGPGATDTKLFYNGKSQEDIEESIDSTPLKRLGKPEDIAKAVVQMATKNFKWMTGQTVYLNGGAA